VGLGRPHLDDCDRELTEPMDMVAWYLSEALGSLKVP
jgi:hypothetical protein